MNKNSERLTNIAGASAATVAASVFAPTLALADMPSGAEILLPKPAEFIPALIAFIVIWIVLAKFAWPSILEMLDKRQKKIQDDLDAAAESKAKAAEEQKAYEAAIRDAHKQADQIVAEAKKEAEEERSKILAKAQREASDIITKSHGAVDSERRKAMIELSSSVVDLSVEIASKIIGNELSEEQQRKLAEKYLAEVSVPDER